MIDVIHLPPVLQGILVVSIISIQALLLYAGYAAIGQIIEQRVLNTTDDT